MKEEDRNKERKRDGRREGGREKDRLNQIQRIEFVHPEVIIEFRNTSGRMVGEGRSGWHGWSVGR